MTCIVCLRAGYSAQGGVGLCQFGGGMHEFGFGAFGATSITTEIGCRVYEGADFASPRVMVALGGGSEVDNWDRGEFRKFG